MSRPIIEVRGVSKAYRLGALGATSLREELSRFWDRRGNGAGAQSPAGDFWALREVSFDVQPGEVLGIIGRNGAGKSTLLKILSRITRQTRGEITLRGRVASLLEVGTGFHSELTGRENIFLNGAILGMRRVEIASKLDEIVAFAEVEQFLDTPVKRYSSGMYVRLAFAVAAHLDPEILLVDEVLAVGDAGFQRKCLARMNDVTRVGRTVLFVSHNMSAVEVLCHRAVWLDGGQVREQGPVSPLVRRYVQSMDGTTDTDLSSRRDRIGDGRLRVSSVSLADATGTTVAALRSGETGHLLVHYATSGPPLRRVLVNVYLTTSWDQRLCDFQTDLVGENFESIPPTGRFICRIPRLPLQPGNYYVGFRVYSSERILLDGLRNATRIIVEQGPFHPSAGMSDPGLLFIDHSWSCEADAIAGASTAAR